MTDSTLPYRRLVWATDIHLDCCSNARAERFVRSVHNDPGFSAPEGAENPGQSLSKVAGDAMLDDLDALFA